MEQGAPVPSRVEEHRETEPVEDDDLLLLLHAGESAIEFKLPDEGWTLVLDTVAAGRGAANPYYLQPRTFALLLKAK